MISIDVTGRTPIYEQICRAICSEIARGMLKENDKIPASRALAQELGLNPNTVSKAYMILERDGIIYTLAGRGSFVAAQNGKAVSALTRDFETITADALNAGVPAEVLIETINRLKGEKQ